jgi:hypothetical protein
MNMNFALRKGWVPAVVVAVIAIIVWMPADPVTEILTLVQTFILTVVALLVLSRALPVARWPASRQRALSWGVALLAAVLVCLEPFVLSTVRR